MPAYILAELKFTERERYDRYQSNFYPVFKQFQGKVLIAQEKPEILEGEWSRDKIVLLEFPTMEEAKRFNDSVEYGEIAKDRRAGADGIVLLLKGWA